MLNFRQPELGSGSHNIGLYYY